MIHFFRQTFNSIFSSRSGTEMLPSVEAMMIVVPEEDGPNSFETSTWIARVSSIIWTFFIRSSPEVAAIPEDLTPEARPFLRFEAEAQELFDAWRADLEHRLRAEEEHPVLLSLTPPVAAVPASGRRAPLAQRRGNSGAGRAS
jgi:hypothetical protein